MRRIDRVGWWALACLALVLSACARVHCFDVVPERVCEGDEVRLKWAARGNVSLETSPAHPAAGVKSDEGEELVALDRTTSFTLSARGLLRDDSEEIEVLVAPPRRGFGEVATCEAEQLHTRVTVANFSPGLRVEELRNVLDRVLVVEKDGRSARLAPGETSPALRDTPVIGTWTLSSPLAPGETCDQALASIRQRLRVEIDMGCGS